MAFTTYKNQVKNITLANLIKSLSSYKLSIAAESEVAKKTFLSTYSIHNIWQHQLK